MTCANRVLSAFLDSLEQSTLAVALSGSVWAYPLVNAAHIVGIALLFGAIVPLDLRLAGARRELDATRLSRLLLPVAIFGFVLAAVAGGLLFITDADDYADSTLFQAKLISIALALANALALRLASGRRRRRGATAVGVRVAATASILLWLTVIVLGRLVGYF